MWGKFADGDHVNNEILVKILGGILAILAGIAMLYWHRRIVSSSLRYHGLEDSKFFSVFNSLMFMLGGVGFVLAGIGIMVMLAISLCQ
jgi:hypothetical protein